MARILLVDDYKNAANSTALLLEMSCPRHEVCIAYTPRHGLRARGRVPPDLLITEATLTGYLPKPQTSGFCLVQKLMKQHHCKAILLTTLGQPHYVEKAKRRGFARHLLKPCVPTVLKAVVGEVLNEETAASNSFGRATRSEHRLGVCRGHSQDPD
jgi:DNA-binding NarL/FixJ family response regulator